MVVLSYITDHISVLSIVIDTFLSGVDVGLYCLLTYIHSLISRQHISRAVVSFTTRISFVRWAFDAGMEFSWVYHDD